MPSKSLSSICDRWQLLVHTAHRARIPHVQALYREQDHRRAIYTLMWMCTLPQRQRHNCALMLLWRRKRMPSGTSARKYSRYLVMNSATSLQKTCWWPGWVGTMKKCDISRFSCCAFSSLLARESRRPNLPLNVAYRLQTALLVTSDAFCLNSRLHSATHSCTAEPLSCCLQRHF
jgi:hypothetical protein